MSDSSRRKFLAAAGAGTAAGAVALTGGAAHARIRRSARSAREPVVALIRDHDSSEVRLMVGESEVVVHDRDLAVRILNAAGGR